MDKLSVDELRQRVVRNYKKGEWNDCIDACLELKERFPGNAGIIAKLAEIYAKAGRRDPAIDTYREAAEKFMQDGKILPAISAYKMILKLAPNLRDIKIKLEEICAMKKPDVPGGKLPEIPLFSELTRDELVEVVHSLKHLKYSMGEIICSEGDEGDSIYAITGGSVKIFVEVIPGEKIDIADLKAGDFFGEVGFFTDGRRHASVMASDDVELLEIGKADFEKIEKKHPRIRDVLEGFYKKRVLDKILAVSPLFRP